MQYLHAVLSMIIGIAVVSVIILVHELGHFIAAKAFKIRVFVFAIGFGKTLFMWKRGDTEYRFNAIPLGGYVQLAENESEEAMKEYTSRPIRQRALVTLAGPAASFLFACVTIWAAYILRR